MTSVTATKIEARGTVDLPALRNVSSVAVIWARFGPYHLARLRAAANLFGESDIGVTGIEVARTDSDYAWRVEEGSEGFTRETVFDGNYHSQSAAEIRRRVVQTLDRVKPDAVGINGWGVPEAQGALIWCRRNKAIAVLMSETLANGLKRIWWKEAAKSLIVRRYHAALVGGEPHREYVARLGISAKRIECGYDAVDNEHFAHGAEKARASADTLRRDLNLPEKYFFVNTRFLPRKNLDGLLRAFALFRRQTEPDWKLVISGGGEIEDKLKQMAADAGVADHVIWPGFLQYQDLPAYYGLASAFIHPAHREAWGLVLNEAAAAALPILASQTTGAALELVRDGENGFLFTTSRDSAIAEAMGRLAKLTDDQRLALGKASRRIVAEWGPERFATGLWRAIAHGERVRR